MVQVNGRWYIVGIHSKAPSQPACSFGGAVDIRADVVSSWVRSLIPFRGDHVSGKRSLNDATSRGDVNNDGKRDFVLTTATSTKLYLSTPSGTGFTQAWTGPGAWVLGDVETALGDFTGETASPESGRPDPDRNVRVSLDRDRV